MPVLLKAPDHALLCFMQYFVRPYANLPNSRWLVEDAQLAPCRPNLPNSGTLVELAQLTEASSDLTNLDFRGSEIFIRVDSWKIFFLLTYVLILMIIFVNYYTLLFRRYLRISTRDFPTESVQLRSQLTPSIGP